MTDTQTENIPPPPKPRGETDRFFGRAGRIAVSFLVIMILAEMITRTIEFVANDVPIIGLDESATLYREHPFIYKVPIPNARFERYEVNEHGFRGRPFEVPKPHNTYRILTLGGSSTWDSNVSGTDATWSAQLEDILNANGGHKTTRFEVVNGGVPGHNSAESVMNFMWRGLPIQPDTVIIYQGYNDYKANRFPGFKSDYSHFRTRDNSLIRAMSEKSRVVYHLRRFVMRKKPKSITKEDQVTQPGIDAYTDNRKIVELARSRNIHVIFSTFAMPLTDDTVKNHRQKFRGLDAYLAALSMRGARHAHRKYNQAVKVLGLNLKVPVVDANSAIPKDFQHFTDHTHLTDLGSSLMAEVMAKTVISTLHPKAK
jgi:lysophospholipase L1-like esterase